MEQEEAVKKVRRRLSSGVIISIAAIIVSVCALFISIFEVRIMREQQHAMAWPYIEWLPGFTGERLTLTVENKGIGPAVIKKMTMEVEGRPVADYGALLRRLLERDSNISYSYSVLSGRVLKPGEEVVTLEVTDPADALKIYRTDKEVTIDICYCSIYERCWRTTGLEARPVANCN